MPATLEPGGRNIARPRQVDSVVAASHGAGTTTSGDVRLLYDPETELRGKDILLVKHDVEPRFVGLTRRRCSWWGTACITPRITATSPVSRVSRTPKE